jgi:putative membrane protein insertion efficiency factor
MQWRLVSKEMQKSGSTMRKLLATFIISLVRLYQKIPHQKSCRFEPSCSTYMILAVEKYGVLKGFVKGVLRIMRCHNPNGGIDYP